MPRTNRASSAPVRADAADETPASDGRRSRILAVLDKPWIAVIAWLAALTVWPRVLLSLPARVTRWDFSHYYVSARALRAGINPYTTDLTALAHKLGMSIGIISHASYPPTFILCFEPLTLLGPAPAYWTWFALNLVFLALALWLLLNRRAGIGGSMAWLLAALAIVYPPLIIHFQYAQTQILILLLLVLMVRALGRGNDAAAGLLLAFAGLIKVFPLVIVGYFIVRRRWRALKWTIIGLAIGGVITLAVVGVRTSFDFLGAAGFVTGSQWLGRWADVSLAAFISRLFGYAGGLHEGRAMAAGRLFVTGLVEVIVLALTVWASARKRDADECDWRALAVWIVTAIMVSPTAWNHYLVLLFLPFLLLVSAALAGRAGRAAVWLMVASYVAPLVLLPLLPWTFGHAPLVVFDVVAEVYFASLVCAYASMWLFASARRFRSL